MGKETVETSLCEGHGVGRDSVVYWAVTAVIELAFDSVSDLGAATHSSTQ